MTVRGFDSFDDAMDDLRRDMDAADAHVQPWQAEIKAGDYFQRASGFGFEIYGITVSDGVFARDRQHR